MKVLLVNTSELTGGAAIAASRLLHALRKTGTEATMITCHKQTDEPSVVQATPPWRHRLHFLIDRALVHLTQRFRKENHFLIDIAAYGTDITRTRAFKEADVIHLHWINQGMLSMHGLRRILRSGKRIVWTMHDMWPFTGVCHYAGHCARFRTACHSCPILPVHGPADVSAQLFRAKHRFLRKALRRGTLTFVACSQWLREQAQQSALLQGHDIRCIANPVDTTVFCPAEDGRYAVRRELGLPVKRRLILFGAQRVSDDRKGMGYVIEMARILKERGAKDLAFVVVGQGAEELTQRLFYPVYAMGYVSDPQRMRNIYRAADVFLTPSLFDNLPNTIVEAMACGTPCVAFRTGGIPEMIDHLGNGYVADYRSAEDLAEGVEHVLAHPSMGEAASYYAQYTYCEERIAKQFVACYSQS